MGIRLMNIPGDLARDKVTNVAIRMLAERQQGTLLTLQPKEMRLRMIRAQSRRRCSHRAPQLISLATSASAQQITHLLEHRLQSISKKMTEQAEGLLELKLLMEKRLVAIPISEGAGSAGTAVAPRAETPPLKPISWVTISDAAVTTPETKPSDDAATDFVSADERADDAGSAS